MGLCCGGSASFVPSFSFPLMYYPSMVLVAILVKVLTIPVKASSAGR